VEQTEEAPKPAAKANIVTVEAQGRTFHLVGTAHISRQSVEAVREAVEGLAPDCVCVELDPERLETLKHPTQWDKLDLAAAIRKGKGAFLLANLAMTAFQRKLGLHTGVRPGAELLEAVHAAEERSIPVDLCDRSIRTTLLRAWRRTGFWKKMWLVSSLLASVFDSTEIDEEELSRLRESDTLSVLLDEMGKTVPTFKKILIDERDSFMAGRLQRAPGQTVVAVVGAGHVPGLTKALQTPVTDAEMAELHVIPDKPLLSRIIPWLFPAMLVGTFAFGCLFVDPARVKGVALAWILTTGLLSAAGTILALGHPLTVLTAFVAAPFTALFHPALGVGLYTGVVQAWIGKPKVRDAEELWDDLSHWKGWWGNRVSRVLLVFMFSKIGATIGMIIAINWLKDLL
jgi:pheromone shutdown-related protein TraB